LIIDETLLKTINMKFRLLFALTLLLFVSCKKTDHHQALLEHWPQQWIFTVDASSDQYTYLEIAGYFMKRSTVLKSYSLISLAEDDDCEFNVAPSKTEDGDDCFTIQLDKKKNWWWFAGLSSNQQEKHLGVTNGASTTTAPGDSDNYKFFIHKMPDVNGTKTIVIESANYPGWYVSDSPPGFNYSQTMVTLTQEDKPEDATHWQCR
jgi:hypothetical protein